MSTKCTLPPAGWACTRTPGHEGPCAAVPDSQWEYYLERMPGGSGIEIIFHTVREVGGKNVARFHDETVARRVAAMPTLERELQERDAEVAEQKRTIEQLKGGTIFHDDYGWLHPDQDKAIKNDVAGLESEIARMREALQEVVDSHDSNSTRRVVIAIREAEQALSSAPATDKDSLTAEGEQYECLPASRVRCKGCGTEADATEDVHPHQPSCPYQQGEQQPLPWSSMATAPKDGTPIVLLIEPDVDRWNPIEDGEVSRTIGFNNFDNDGEDKWQFCGWCWTHDHIVEGAGNPIGWQPLPPPPAKQDQQWKFIPSHDVGGKAVPEYWQNEETGEIHYGDEPPKL